MRERSSMVWARAALLLAVFFERAACGGAGMIGLDVGTQNSVVAVARRGGVDVMANEATRRQTPSLVGFDARQRHCGERAAALRSSRPRDVLAPRALLGAAHNPADAEATAAEATAEYLGETKHFSRVQLLAILLHHLRQIAEREHGGTLPEAVIAVPAHFSTHQRGAMLDAAALAGVRAVSMISEGAAVALDYALGRRDLSADSDRVVAFVDIGASGAQVNLARLRRGRLQLVSYVHVRDAGGSALDQLLVERLGAQIVERYGVDPLASPRATQRLRIAAEKLRRVLSANTEARSPRPPPTP